MSAGRYGCIWGVARRQSETSDYTGRVDSPPAARRPLPRRPPDRTPNSPQPTGATARTERAGESVVGECRDKNAEHDRQRAAKARGKEQCKQLRLVADFADGDDQHRNKERFHGRNERKGSGGASERPLVGWKQRSGVPAESPGPEG